MKKIILIGVLLIMILCGCSNNKNEESTINFDMIIAKAKYSNPKLSKILHIITNPVALIVLLVSVVLIPELTYKRY